MLDSPDRFAACAATTMAEHGGFRAHDPLLGGPSAHGVGLGLLSVWIGGPADIGMLRALRSEDATRILRGLVWAPLGAARLPAGVDLALFAYAFEAGTVKAMADLQAELGVPPSGTADAATLDAARARSACGLASAIQAAHASWRGRRGLPFTSTAIRQRNHVAPCPA
ncbi:hypothetical protein KPL78_09170 [Roseomonas sp. HJA6]|uniref:TtsA-like Glycoside hydrolase family 108 domain-containing protein n=1 Tax=Roseomonas alba TaxID=2846776 RepID=A0ABS7A9M1_9PROT|nr:glycosyl hydrolase 108 family protein [Neoroseomonas alba]MBW6398015.1 hypothetical protein [Neoroseomonas alba]